MRKRILSVLLITILCIGMVYGSKTKDSKKVRDVKTFTAFFATTGDTIDQDNDIKQIIAEKTGACCEEKWINGQTAEEAIYSYIANEEYPDFISGNRSLYEANALIPIDEYWERYPNIYNYLSQEEWDKFRQEDGHIYWIPQFGVGNNEECEVVHDGEAFWIQTRVLKWAGYPKIRTMDQYFDLIENYMKANPTMEDGTANIPYTILCDDWRYFCLENAPQFLDGYPNDGCCMVNPETLQVMDYNITPTAKKYFQKLNEEYHKGMVDPESFTSTYEEYLNKLSTGSVLGMIDQWWDFSYSVSPLYAQNGLERQGCNYVPLPITISEDIQNQWHTKKSSSLDNSTGISLTVSCKDVKGALQFINDLLDEEIQKLRFWGLEGLDYEINSDGEYYFTQEQKERRNNDSLIASHYCVYSYFPRIECIMSDGINSSIPEFQQSVFYDSLPEDVKECFDAYGCKNYVEMIGSNDKPGEWFPMYSFTKQLTYSSEAGLVQSNLDEVKHTWLPKVILSDNFEETWKQYLIEYNSCNPEIYYEEIQRELERRVKQ